MCAHELRICFSRAARIFSGTGKKVERSKKGKWAIRISPFPRAYTETVPRYAFSCAKFPCSFHIFSCFSAAYATRKSALRCPSNWPHSWFTICSKLYAGEVMRQTFHNLFIYLTQAAGKSLKSLSGARSTRREIKRSESCRISWYNLMYPFNSRSCRALKHPRTVCAPPHTPPEE